MIYILSILFTITFVIYTKWQFSDDRGITSGKWHLWGALMRILMILTPYLMQIFPSNIEDYILSGAINILLWEIMINLIALNTKWNHIGTTSEFDKKLGKLKWGIMFLILIGAIIYKIWQH